MQGREIHCPVMVQEVTALLDCRRGGKYVDATVGAGGHGAAILEASSPDGFLVGIDRDRNVLDKADEALRKFRGRYALVHSNFRDMKSVLQRMEAGPVDGVLLDLGISSWQVDSPERGFSFRSEAALDMRMDQSRGMTAEQLIRETSEDKLAMIIRNYGDETRSRVIARAVKDATIGGGRLTTTRLAEAVESAIGGRRERGRKRIHPATRTFQALRIAVNDEMESLKEVLESLPDLLVPGGRCCCLAYHSLEDRIVKNAFRDMSGRGMEKRTPVVAVLTKKPLRPSAEEVRSNPRSRSARLRAASRLEA